MTQPTTQHRRAKSKVPPHPFVRDETVPAEQAGHYACRCGLLGEPGDAHHTLPDAPEQAEHLRRYEPGDE